MEVGPEPTVGSPLLKSTFFCVYIYNDTTILQNIHLLLVLGGTGELFLQQQHSDSHALRLHQRLSINWFKYQEKTDWPSTADRFHAQFGAVRIGWRSSLFSLDW